MDKQACLGTTEGSIVEDEATIDAELERLDKLQSAINTRRAQLQTAKDKTTKPWNKGIRCTVHAELRKAHEVNKHVKWEGT
jgi:hypothetical protein